MIITDTHTHLYSDAFDVDRAEMIQRAIDANVTRFFIPAIDSTHTESMLQLEKDFPEHVFLMMGLHPTSVKDNYKEELRLVDDLLAKRKFCAIGEIGIDLYWDSSFLKQQQDAFRFQIALAKKHQLPFVIHCRDAFDEIFEILDELNDTDMRGIFHCFTGTIEQAQHIINYGNFKIGIGGVVTFKNAGLDKVVEQIALKHLVLETDAPYLAPTPYRGKRNESTYLYLIAEKVASLHHTSIEEVAAVTTKNSVEIFGF